eukprot:CAMPEP_0117480528 /NCGR_PEP_ID=MMETSP0784-20121206/12436_1 /TAXON_ID=39447 /ORGANISM="" /LENGTH=610 /DNA_ID=CAMNT_0005274967 /DNA_START=173 /DNA_END=2005 /DNA_ORIENTATION=+
MCQGEFVTTTVLNCVFTLLNSLMYCSWAAKGIGADEQLVHRHATWFIFDDIIITLLACFVSHAIKSNYASSSAERVESQKVAMKESAMTRFVTAMCDAVVHLGPNYEVMAGWKQLNELLAGGTPRMRSSADFRDVLAGKDKLVFTDSYNKLKDEDEELKKKGLFGHATSLHLWMVSNSGTLIRVQLFMVKSRTLNKGFESYVCICKLSQDEIEACMHAGNQVRGSQGGAEAKSLMDAGASLESRMQDFLPYQNDGNSDANSSGSSWVFPTHGDIEDVSFQFDVTTFQITSGSTAFLHVGGCNALGADIRDWILERTSFEAHISKLRTHLAETKVVPKELGTITCFRFSPPAARLANLELSAKLVLRQADECTPSTAHSDTSKDFGESPWPFNGTLTNLQMRRSRTNHRASPVTTQGGGKSSHEAACLSDRMGSMDIDVLRRRPSAHSMPAPAEDVARIVGEHAFGDADEMEVCFDAMSFQIIWANHAFAPAGGQSVKGANICDWIVDRQKFENYIQQTVNHALHYEVVPADMSTLPGVKLRGCVERDMTCTLRPVQEEDSDDRFVVAVVFKKPSNQRQHDVLATTSSGGAHSSHFDQPCRARTEVSRVAL